MGLSLLWRHLWPRQRSHVHQQVLHEQLSCLNLSEFRRRFVDAMHPQEHWIKNPANPCWSALDFWKKKFEKFSLMNLVFNLQKSISKLIFAGNTGSKNPLWNSIQFIELDFSNLIFHKSSIDQQDVRVLNGH